jgi:hypothetical protein
MDSLKTFCELPRIDDAQAYLTWHRDPRLARYLRGLEDKSPEQIADILVQRIGDTPTDKLASDCVTALLAHLLFSTSGRARIRSQIFNPLQHHAAQIDLADLYQIALDIISQPVKFLGNFQPDQTSWYGSLVRYSNCRFDRVLIDRIRSFPGMSGFKRTNLGLLARTSPSRIKTALIEQGEQALRLEQLELLHQCLRVVIAAGEFETRDPQPEHYDRLLARYTEQEIEVPLVKDRAMLIKELAYMGTVIRNYIQPQLDALDRSIGNNEAEGRSLGELIPDRIRHSQLLESRLIKQDILDLSSQLPIDHDRLLMFLYGLQLTQTETGAELDCNQTTAKHRHDRCLKQLAVDLYTKTFPEGNLSIEYLDVIIDALKTIYEDIYPELLLDIFGMITGSTAKPPESMIVELFIDRVQDRWQFMFKPAQKGLTKAITFARSISGLTSCTNP